MTRKPTPEYISIGELAERLSVSKTTARCMAKSKLLRNIKDAVVDTNQGRGKYEILRINIHDAIKVHAAYYKGWK